MSGNENFCLRLNEFERYATTAWREFKIEEYLCDVTLACEDKSIKAHRLVISSFSPVLKNILKLNQNPHPLIYLRRVRYIDLQNLLNFMYQGEVNVAEEDLARFLEVSEDLNIKGLSERNMGNSDSREIDSLDSIQANINQTMELKGQSAKKESEQNVSTYQSSGSISELKEMNERKSTFLSSKNKEIIKKNSKQNIISKLADKQFSCLKCDKIFSGESGLYCHTRSVHEEIRFNCDQCNYKATRKSELQRHVRSIHEGLRYPCDQCDYKATDKSNLRHHRLKRHN